jgi:hypothetical protein
MSTPAIQYKSLKADPLTTKSPVGVLAEENSVKQRFFFVGKTFSPGRNLSSPPKDDENHSPVS